MMALCRASPLISSAGGASVLVTSGAAAAAGISLSGLGISAGAGVTGGGVEGVGVVGIAGITGGAEGWAAAAGAGVTERRPCAMAVRVRWMDPRRRSIDPETMSGALLFA